MHAAFIWTCSNSDHHLGDVAALVNLPVKPKPSQLQEFFWKHLEKDLETISVFLHRGQEECILVLHLVLKEILTNQLNLRMAFTAYYNTLRSIAFVLPGSYWCQN